MYGRPKNVCVVTVIPVCNVRLDVPSICFVCLCVCMSEVISSFRSLRAGSQVFALLMLFLYVILHTMWAGKSPQLLCILPFGILCLSVIIMKFVKMILAVCVYICFISYTKGIQYVDGYCGKLCPVGFLVVCECSSVLLQSIVVRLLW